MNNDFFLICATGYNYLNIKIKMHEIGAACSMFPRILRGKRDRKRKLGRPRYGWVGTSDRLL
jgi:hypothetical protein